MRQTVDETWSAVAESIAGRTRCVRSAVGCVIVDADGRVAATGYNGPPAGYRAPGFTCAEFCPRGAGAQPRHPAYHDCPAIHAELNALLYSDRRAREGATLYVTKPPCWSCALAIAGSGVVRIVVPGPVSLEVGQLLEQSGVEVS